MLTSYNVHGTSSVATVVVHDHTDFCQKLRQESQGHLAIKRAEYEATSWFFKSSTRFQEKKRFLWELDSCLNAFAEYPTLANKTKLKELIKKGSSDFSQFFSYSGLSKLLDKYSLALKTVPLTAIPLVIRSSPSIGG